MENGEDNQPGQNEEPSPFVPDLGLPSDESVNHGQGLWKGSVMTDESVNRGQGLWKRSVMSLGIMAKVCRRVQ